jgi:hypothetical protein
MPSRKQGRSRASQFHQFEGKEKLVNISKDQIVQLLESQGNHDKAQQASQQLPDQVDTDNGQHADLLSKLGLDTGSLGNQLGGLGKIL